MTSPTWLVFPDVQSRRYHSVRRPDLALVQRDLTRPDPRELIDVLLHGSDDASREKAGRLGQDESDADVAAIDVELADESHGHNVHRSAGAKTARIVHLAQRGNDLFDSIIHGSRPPDVAPRAG